MFLKQKPEMDDFEKCGSKGKILRKKSIKKIFF